MTQLVLDMDFANIELPESLRDGYSVTREPLYVDIEMYSGRLTRELRGYVWKIKYQYGYFDELEKNRLIATCEKGIIKPLRCAFLKQEADGDALTEGTFLVTSFKRPRFMWGRGGVPVWADFELELREVDPHE